MSYLRELPMFSAFRDVKPIRKGMSGDEKYCITTTDDQRLLLRISDPQDLQRKQKEYRLLKQFAELKIPMPQPVDFGVFGEDKKVYTLLTWIDGYFKDLVPEDFWRLLAYYLSVSAITSIVWAKYFAPERLKDILTMNTDILCQFDNMKQLIPKWYTMAKKFCN